MVTSVFIQTQNSTNSADPQVVVIVVVVVVPYSLADPAAEIAGYAVLTNQTSAPKASKNLARYRVL